MVLRVRDARVDSPAEPRALSDVRRVTVPFHSDHPQRCESAPRVLPSAPELGDRVYFRLCVCMRERARSARVA